MVDEMRALVHLPDPAVLSFVSSELLEVDWPVGIVADISEGGDPIAMDLNGHLIYEPSLWAVVATSTITEASIDPDTVISTNENVGWRYVLAPLRECDPITDLPCGRCAGEGWLIVPYGVGVGGTANCPACSFGGRVPLPEVPTGGVVIL